MIFAIKMIKSEVTMKTKKNKERLMLKKITIARLNNDTMNLIKAGEPETGTSAVKTETCPLGASIPYSERCTITHFVLPV
jgi:hypothetical protein